MEKLIIAGREFNSRLFLGTGKFSSNEWMEQSILASGTEMVTVAMKRVDMESTEDDMLKHIVHPHIQLLPNTSGVRNAEEAVFAAQMARESFSNIAASASEKARPMRCGISSWKEMQHINVGFPFR